MRLAGKGCLIIGGTGGIGRAAAWRFLLEGARVFISGLTQAECDEALEELRPHGPVSGGVLDVADAGAVETWFDAALAWLGGRVDVVFHVAGISGRSFGDGALHECSSEGWGRVLEVNLGGVFFTNRAAVRRMRAQEPDRHGLRGSVLNLGSVLARAPSPRHFGTIAYSASKGGVETLTRAAAAAYAAEGIRFNVVAPALIHTPMSHRAVTDPAITAYLETKQPIAGGAGRPADVVEAAVFLCEPASRFVTGVVLPVDGGWTIAEGQLDFPDGPEA